MYARWLQCSRMCPCVVLCVFVVCCVRSVVLCVHVVFADLHLFLHIRACVYYAFSLGYTLCFICVHAVFVILFCALVWFVFVHAPFVVLFYVFGVFYMCSFGVRSFCMFYMCSCAVCCFYFCFICIQAVFVVCVCFIYVFMRCSVGPYVFYNCFTGLSCALLVLCSGNISQHIGKSETAQRWHDICADRCTCQDKPNRRKSASSGELGPTYAPPSLIICSNLRRKNELVDMMRPGTAPSATAA